MCKLVLLWLSLALLGVDCQDANTTQGTEQIALLPTEATVTTELIAVARERIACESPHGLNGSCVSMDNCDYGTQNIDRRLFHPGNYTSPCVSPGVCCPVDWVTKPEDKPKVVDYSSDFK